jgi:hypothetical protein
MRALIFLSLMGSSCIFVIGQLTKEITCGNNKIDAGEVCYVQPAFLLENAPNDLDIADLNGDGQLDIAVASFVPAVSIHLNLGGGTFAPPRALDLTGTQLDFPNDVIAVTLPQDRFGLLVASAVNVDPPIAEVVFFESLGAGDFDLGVPTQIGSSLPSHLVAFDANDDGAVDVALSDREFGTQQITVLTSDPSGDPLFNAPENIGGLTGPLFVTSADMNGDGNDDLLVGQQDGSKVRILFFSQGLLIDSHEEVLGGLPSETIVGDFDGDSRLDFAVGVTLDDGVGEITSTLEVFLQRDEQANLFEKRVLTPQFLSGVTERMAPSVASDIDQDGDVDIAAMTDKGSLTLFLNDGAGEFSGDVAFSFLQSLDNPDVNSIAFSAIRSGDLNGDQVPDFAALSSGGGGLDAVLLLLSTR